jgi:hypothetical protein
MRSLRQYRRLLYARRVSYFIGQLRYSPICRASGDKTIVAVGHKIVLADLMFGEDGYGRREDE